MLGKPWEQVERWQKRNKVFTFYINYDINKVLIMFINRLEYDSRADCIFLFRNQIIKNG